MTTNTDRTSAEILAALDKLAENGMPFIDVVKRDGFSGFHAKGAQPLPTEPVPVHEDPGAAYWKEATKMAEHTDRIKQMAQEAGIVNDARNLEHMPTLVESLEAFAQLVAEDCARVMREEFAKMAPTIAQAAQEGESVTHVTEMCAAAVAFRVNARYSLATPSQAG